MDLQGGIGTCVIVDLLKTVATEDLGLPYLYDPTTKEVAAGEGVWLVTGSYSSNPGVYSHYSLKYRDADGNEYFIDAQGQMLNETSPKVTCEAHDCKSKIVSLK